MKLGEKLLILFVAIILSVLGFYLISSSFAELHALAKRADTGLVDNLPAKHVGDRSLQFTFLNIFGDTSCLSRAPGASK